MGNMKSSPLFWRGNKNYGTPCIRTTVLRADIRNLDIRYTSRNVSSTTVFQGTNSIPGGTEDFDVNTHMINSTALATSQRTKTM